jgi:hypothetical protein
MASRKAECSRWHARVDAAENQLTIRLVKLSQRNGATDGSNLRCLAPVLDHTHRCTMETSALFEAQYAPLSYPIGGVVSNHDSYSRSEMKVFTPKSTRGQAPQSPSSRFNCGRYNFLSLLWVFDPSVVEEEEAAQRARLHGAYPAVSPCETNLM